MDIHDILQRFQMKRNKTQRNETLCEGEVKYRTITRIRTSCFALRTSGLLGGKELLLDQGPIRRNAGEIRRERLRTLCE